LQPAWLRRQVLQLWLRMQLLRQPVSLPRPQVAEAQALRLSHRPCRLVSAAEAVLASRLSRRLRLLALAVGVARASRPSRRRHLPAWAVEEARALPQLLPRQRT
jgi:hypothetical protein